MPKGLQGVIIAVGIIAKAYYELLGFLTMICKGPYMVGIKALWPIKFYTTYEFLWRVHQTEKRSNAYWALVN